MKESITTNREITRKIHTLESPPEIGYQAAPLILLFLFLISLLRLFLFFRLLLSLMMHLRLLFTLLLLTLLRLFFLFCFLYRFWLWNFGSYAIKPNSKEKSTLSLFKGLDGHFVICMEWVIGENERELDLGRIRREDLLLHGWSLFRDELCRLVDDCAHVRGRHNHANNTVRTRTHLKVKRFVGKSLP